MSDSGTDDRNRLSGWAVLVIAVICTAYWLTRAGVLSSELAVILGAAAAAVILAVGGTVRSRARRRRELNGRLAAAMRRAAER
jgi:hypothetical protein